MLRFGRLLAGPWLACVVSAPALAQTAEETEDAFSLEIVYTGDIWSNIRGGVNRGSVYLDNLDVIATIDAERSLGLDGTTIAVSGLYNNRRSFSDRVVGDAQVVSNIDTGGSGSLRIFEAWIDHEFGDGAIKLGLIDLNSEFDTNETGSLFVNSSHGIGPDFSQIGQTGPSIFPVAGLGARARLRLAPNLLFRLGVFEGVPGNPKSLRHTALRLDRHEGMLVVGEAEYKPTDESRFVLGLRRLSQTDGASNLDIEPREAQFGGYALVEGPVAKVGSATLGAFVRFGLADPDAHEIARYIGAGTVLSGTLLGREGHQERLGLAVGKIRRSDRFKSRENGPGTQSERHETVLELTYRIQVTEWLALQPDAQYIINPGHDSKLRNAMTAGLRLELSWTTEP